MRKENGREERRKRQRGEVRKGDGGRRGGVGAREERRGEGSRMRRLYGEEARQHGVPEEAREARSGNEEGEDAGRRDADAGRKDGDGGEATQEQVWGGRRERGRSAREAKAKRRRRGGKGDMGRGRKRMGGEGQSGRGTMKDDREGGNEGRTGEGTMSGGRARLWRVDSARWGTERKPWGARAEE
ncbi:hypothetical protein DFH09DRAFT_1421619 [Mycena vulgaris]|nr:hypothetical protein DFH09DRAFT_1421619 [Mycena vulgaris]